MGILIKTCYQFPRMARRLIRMKKREWQEAYIYLPILLEFRFITLEEYMVYWDLLRIELLDLINWVPMVSIIRFFSVRPLISYFGLLYVTSPLRRAPPSWRGTLDFVRVHALWHTCHCERNEMERGNPNRIETASSLTLLGNDSLCQDLWTLTHGISNWQTSIKI